MNAFEIIEKSTLVINSVLLLFLGVRHLQEMSRHRRQSEKLQLELEALKRETSAANQRIVRPTDEDLNKLVVQPITHRLDEMTRYLPSAHSDLSADHVVPAAVEHTLRLLRENTDRLTASQAEFLHRQEQLFHDASGWMRAAIAAGLKDVHLELRINTDKS